MLTGGCFCGAVRYRTEAMPFHETICHCADCRRIAGAHVVAWFSVPASSLTVDGEPTRFASSPGVERSFCARCGTTLTYRAEATGDEIDVTIASLDEPNRMPPRDHTGALDRLVWDALCDGLPVLPGGRAEPEGK